MPSSSRRILVALVSGIALGIFLGDLVAPLHWVAEAYIKLLQMTVLPYVTVSIIGGLGRLRLGEARVLGTRTVAVLATLWGLAILFMFLIPLAFPTTQNASFFSTTLVEKPPPFDFIDLYIPSNPFRSLADNIVPAVVLFSVLLGIALITVERKHVVLDVLHVCGEALARVARMIIRLTPYGLFAIAATAAGTMTVDQFGRLQIYIVIYVLVTLLIALWVLPGLIAALTQIPMRTVFAASHNALLTAFAAGDLFIVLPGLIDACRTLVAERASADSEASTVAGCDRARVVQLPAHGQARVTQLRAVCRLVLGRRDSLVRLSAPGRHGVPGLVRQPEHLRALSARPVPHSRRYVSTVPGQRGDQCALRDAARRDAHARRWRAWRLCDGRPPSHSPPCAGAISRGDDRAHSRSRRRRTCGVRLRIRVAVHEGSSPSADAPAATGRRRHRAPFAAGPGTRR